MAPLSRDFQNQADLSLHAAAYISLHTAGERELPGPTEDQWTRASGAAGWNAPTTTLRSAWVHLPGFEDIEVWRGQPVHTWPEWGGGLYANAQLSDPTYRAAVARWVANEAA